MPSSFLNAPVSNAAPLLELLQSIKPNVLYTMASPKQLKAAANLFAKDYIDRFVWGESGRSLVAVIGSGGDRDVLFTCRAEKLHITCNCGGDRVNPCCHLLVAMMVIARVMRGSKFHPDDLPPESLEALRESLRLPEEATASDPPRVILVHEKPGEPYRLDFDSGQPGPSWLSEGAPEGMEWLHWQTRDPSQVADSFLAWLNKASADFLLELRPAPNDTPAFPCQNLRITSATARERLSLGKTGVTVERLLLDANGKPLSPFVDLGYGLAFAYEQQTIAKVDPPNAAASVERTTLDLDTFHQRRITPAPHREVLLSKAKTTDPETFESRPALFAETKGDFVHLTLRVVQPDETLVPIHEPVAERLLQMRNQGLFVNLLAKPQRRRRLFAMLGQILIEPDTRETILEAALDDPLFGGPTSHGREARRCLAELDELCRDLDTPFFLVNPKQKPAWRIATRSGRTLGLWLSTLQRLFIDLDPFTAAHLETRMEAPRFGRQLGLLAAACESQNAVLRFNGEPVRSATLDLTVDILRSGDLDWFELHPSVRAGSLDLSRELWLQILQSGFYQAADGSFIAVDPESLEALAALQTRLRDGDRTHRLQLFDWLAMRQAGIACSLPEEESAVLDAILAMENVPTQTLPAGLKAELRPYQRHGYDWLAFLYTHRFGACLADDMGLGKTLQAITLLLAIHEGILPAPTQAGPHLVVLPPTLLFNWHHEIERFAPTLRVLEYIGPNRSTDFGKVDVVLTTYELFRRDQDLLAEQPFAVAIFDEAQAIKNPLSRRAKALNRLRAAFRVCLTGTPLENHYREFHQIMETAVPGLFGAAKPSATDEPPAHLLERTRPFLLRRTKSTILTELPPKVESDTWLELAESQKEFYTRAVGEVRKEILDAYAEKPSQQAGIVALSALMRLRQICISPAMLGDDLPDDSPKLDHLTEQLAELQEENHAVLVFSHFTTGLDLLQARLKTAGLAWLRLDGSVPTPKRRELVKQFQSGEGPGIFLISTKTGGAGLNLTRASYVYHLDPWWNPAVENQASDRAHRIGQKQSVFIQRLLMRHSVEEKITVLKKKKQALFEAVVAGSEAEPTGAAKLTAEDFRFLLE